MQHSEPDRAGASARADADDRAGWWPRTRLFGRRLLAETAHDRLAGLAAETAFFVVLSIFPGLLIAASLLGVLDVVVGQDVAVQAQERVVGALRLVLTDEASGAVSSVENLFVNSSGQLLTLAGLGGVVTISGAFAVVIAALNTAYDTGESRAWWKRRLLGLGLAVASMLVVALALVVLVVGPLFGRGDELADVVGLGATFTLVWDLVRLPVMVLAVVVWAAAMFHLAPARRTRWRDALPGAVLTAVLWLLGSGGFHLYLRLVSDENPILGAFGGGVIVMVWVYLLSLALLLGGELNAVLLKQKRSVA